MSAHAFRLEVDQLVAEAKDLFGDGHHVHRRAELLYESVVEAIKELEADEEPEEDRPESQDYVDFYAENPVPRRLQGDYEDYRAVWACTQAQQARAMRNGGF